MHHKFSIDTFSFRKIIDRRTFAKINAIEIDIKYEISKENSSKTPLTAQPESATDSSTRDDFGILSNGECK